MQRILGQTLLHEASVRCGRAIVPFRSQQNGAQLLRCAAAAQPTAAAASPDAAVASVSTTSAAAAGEQVSKSTPAKPDRKSARAGPPPATGGEADSSKPSMVDTQPPRGTRDFFPEDYRLRSWLFNEFATVSQLFGFEQWDAPVLESEELFVRKAGEEITEQLYNFEDKGGRRMALRPELTPSLARMILARQKVLNLPAKWFAVGQCWRYERMTRGRRREHYQWNMDIVGVPGVEAEAELLAAITLFFERVGLSSKEVGIKVSNRKVLQAVLATYGVPPEQFAPVCVVVDKIEKLPREEVVKQLGELGVAPATIDGLLGAMSLKSLDDLERLLGPSSEAVVELKRLFELAAGYGYADWLVFDPSVVRGLAYYTGTVFEGFDREGKLRAICGGGRYDRLLGTFGGEDLPCCGFGFGDAVIVELLKETNKLPVFKQQVEDLVVALDESLRSAASGVAQQLRRAGRKVELVLEAKKMKVVFKQAERLGAARVVLVGSDEWARGAVSVKDLAAREQKEVAVADLTKL